MNSLGVTVLLCCGLIAFGACRPSDTEESEDVLRESKREKHYQQYPLPYWAFVPALGVWPDGSTTTTTTTTTAAGIRVDMDRGQVSVIPVQKFQKYRKHPNTPSVDGPSKLKKTQSTERPVTKIYLKPAARARAGPGGVALANPVSTAVVRRGDTVSIEYLPEATAEAGAGGVAISRPELIIQLVD